MIGPVSGGAPSRSGREIGPIGDDAVDAEVDQLGHVDWVIHGPGDHQQAGAVCIRQRFFNRM